MTAGSDFPAGNTDEVEGKQHGSVVAEGAD